MNKKEITKILRKWWHDENTCGGKPHCLIEHCDLCTNCLFDLCGKLGIKGEDILNKDRMREIY